MSKEAFIPNAEGRRKHVAVKKEIGFGFPVVVGLFPSDSLGRRVALKIADGLNKGSNSDRYSVTLIRAGQPYYKSCETNPERGKINTETPEVEFVIHGINDGSTHTDRELKKDAREQLEERNPQGLQEIFGIKKNGYLAVEAKKVNGITLFHFTVDPQVHH